ncbi:hypothetical protein CARUB_v10014562mg [Capsella rubella]|uniref:RING-type E3 ubiquitin transferase n=1 Tax=Capsella rubella TaxID=81985 RepID=R0G7C9_9BRAS|nr:uncharacterized protein LOC17891774 [Capsella rubella]EOA31386.1 hypothetical protein CARUB_v10014562mg [Capsella rubella]
MVFYATEAEPDSLISVETIYNKDVVDLGQNQNLMLDFQVDYTLAPDVDSDGDEDLTNLETRTLHQIQRYDKDWLIGGDEDQIQAIVYHILDLIEVPCYTSIVRTLTDEIVGLKELDAISPLRNVERIKVTMDVIVWTFPGEGGGDMDVRLAVAPASDEAVETHLETVIVGSDYEGYCVICMDKIRVGTSDVEAALMPCQHVFHRMCVEEWLRNSGVCPVCRAMLPS